MVMRAVHRNRPCWRRVGCPAETAVAAGATPLISGGDNNESNETQFPCGSTTT
jgi:hypothetical protein